MEKNKIIFWIFVVLIVILIIGYLIINSVISKRLLKLKDMSFNDMILYTTENNKEAKISVGIIKEGEFSYHVYGSNGEEIENKEFEYEIGSITKTFTTSLLCKAVEEKKINIDESIDEYLKLDDDKYYPDIKRIITHTSGYKQYYLDSQIAKNFFKGEENSFYGIKKETILKQVKRVKLKDKSYDFKYSNFGISVIGLILEEIYNKPYDDLMNEYISNDFNLKETKLSTSKGENFWRWKNNDGYKSSGAVVSNIKDITEYLNIQLNEKYSYLSECHKPLVSIEKKNKKFVEMGINIDSVASGWMIDNENNIIWHNGATSNYNSYIGFDKEKKIGVVILSNLSPNYKIPSTVMGIKLIKEIKN